MATGVGAAGGAGHLQPMDMWLADEEPPEEEAPDAPPPAVVAAGALIPCFNTVAVARHILEFGDSRSLKAFAACSRALRDLVYTFSTWRMSRPCVIRTHPGALHLEHVGVRPPTAEARAAHTISFSTRGSRLVHQLIKPSGKSEKHEIEIAPDRSFSYEYRQVRLCKVALGNSSGQIAGIEKDRLHLGTLHDSTLSWRAHSQPFSPPFKEGALAHGGPFTACAGRDWDPPQIQVWREQMDDQGRPMLENFTLYTEAMTRPPSQLAIGNSRLLSDGASGGALILWDLIARMPVARLAHTALDAPERDPYCLRRSLARQRLFG